MLYINSLPGYLFSFFILEKFVIFHSCAWFVCKLSRAFMIHPSDKAHFILERRNCNMVQFSKNILAVYICRNIPIFYVNKHFIIMGQLDSLKIKFIAWTLNPRRPSNAIPYLHRSITYKIIICPPENIWMSHEQSFLEYPKIFLGITFLIQHHFCLKHVFINVLFPYYKDFI